MIGALLLRRAWKSRTEKAFAARDVDGIVAMWAEDGVLEFGGTHDMAGRYEGSEEIRVWLTRWFDRMETLEFRVGRVAVARPLALGLSNTVMYEAHVVERSWDGVSVEADVVAVADVRAGKLVHVRDYPFDETPELAMWGPRSGRGTARGSDPPA